MRDGDSQVLDFLTFVEGEFRSSPPRLLQRILKKCRDLSGAEAGTIFLVHRKGATRWLAPAVIQNDRVRVAKRDFVVPLDHDSIAGHVALTGDTLRINDAQALDPTLPFHLRPMSQPKGFVTRSMLAFPLMRERRKIIGVVQLINRRVPGVAEPMPFDDWVVDLVAPVATVLGSTIERAQLLERIAAKNKVLRERNQRLATQSRQVARLQEETEEAFMLSIRLLARASEIHDEGTGNHIVRVNEYSYALARADGLPSAFCDEIRYCAQLHDVGKMSVDAAVLKKTGPLDERERAEMSKHPIYGWQILSQSARLGMAAEIALNHHEKWDGTGYPSGRKGDAIPLSARIVQIADVYDALRAERPYKPALDHGAAVRVMLEGDARIHPEGHFDPHLLDVFRRIHPEFGRIWDRLVD